MSNIFRESRPTPTQHEYSAWYSDTMCQVLAIESKTQNHPKPSKTHSLSITRDEVSGISHAIFLQNNDAEVTGVHTRSCITFHTWKITYEYTYSVKAVQLWRWIQVEKTPFFHIFSYGMGWYGFWMILVWYGFWYDVVWYGEIGEYLKKSLRYPLYPWHCSI